MKAKLIPICAVAIVSILLFGCSQPAEAPGLEFMQDASSELTCEMFQEQPHHSGDIVLGVDGTLTVILCSNPTTGFEWLELPQISDTSVLRQETHEFMPPEDENIIGGAGKEIFTFKTLKKGVSTINFEYSRPWEGGEKAEWTFELEVHVRERSSTTELKVANAIEARDAALSYLRELHPQNAPDTGIEWREEAPTGLVGGTTIVFTTDNWQIKVSWPVVAPENTIYTIVVSSINLGWHWKGKVSADGSITEVSAFRQMSQEESQNLAEEFLRNSATYVFDGIEGTLRVTDTLKARCPYCWVFIFEFDSEQPGFGDRTGKILAEMITHHKAVIAVEQLEIISAVMDDQWDMLRHEIIGVEETLEVADLLGSPVYDTLVRIHGEVSGLGDFFCPCFELTSGGKTVLVWYDMMVENDGAQRPPANRHEFNNGDRVIVIGELKGEGGVHYSKGDFWAMDITRVLPAPPPEQV